MFWVFVLYSLGWATTALAVMIVQEGDVKEFTVRAELADWVGVGVGATIWPLLAVVVIPALLMAGLARLLACAVTR